MTNEIDVLVGQVVEERYLIEATLGAGGMGAVYRARHIKVGREVAIKVLHDHLVQDPTMVERFEREAEIAAKLDHKNLVSVIDVGETATKQKLMVLELARGENLADIIARGPLGTRRTMTLTAQLLAGLEHAHDAGLVHRDLKPDNVIVEIDEAGAEVPRIVDFGIAMLRGDSSARLTANGQVMGTPQYMAPEHAQGKDVDPRCDLFALGVMAYEMLSGKLPFDAQGIDAAIANITKEPPAIAKRAPAVEVDPLVEAFVRRLMARRRGDRFQSARAALDVLELIDAHPDAAYDILLRPPATLPPRAARGSSPMSMPAGRTLPMAVVPPSVPPVSRPVQASSSAVADARLGVAETVEAMAPRLSRTPRRLRRITSLALLGALAAVTTAAATLISSSVGSRVEAAAPLPLQLALTPPPARLAVRAVARVEAPPPAPARATPVVIVAPPAPALVVVVAPRPVIRGSVERAVVKPIAEQLVPRPAVPPTAAEVAARYVATGQRLARLAPKRGVDASLEAFRRIHIHQAVATPAARAETLRELARIDRALVAAQ